MVSPLLTALIGVVVERLMIRRIYNRDPVYSLLLTFGLAFVMQDVARYIWGPNGLPMGLPDVLAQPITSDLFFITWYRIFMVAIVIVTVIGLFAFLRYTRVSACASAPERSISKPSRRSASMFAICAHSISPSAAFWPA